MIDDVQYDSAVQRSRDSLLILSGPVSMMNHSDRSPLVLTTGGCVRRKGAGALFRRRDTFDASERVEILVQYDRPGSSTFRSNKASTHFAFIGRRRKSDDR